MTNWIETQIRANADYKSSRPRPTTKKARADARLGERRIYFLIGLDTQRVFREADLTPYNSRLLFDLGGLAAAW